MTITEEYALELVNKFRRITDERGLRSIKLEHAKQCALIAVDEMISMLPFTDLTTYIGKWCEQQRQYLEDVKQEIEKL
jgi:hypothetical protein